MLNRRTGPSTGTIPVVLAVVTCLLSGCGGAGNGHPDAGQPPDKDDDRDGVLTSVELEAGTDPQDPSSAPQWQPQWSGHPRLLFDPDTWTLIKDAILAEDPAYRPYYDRLKQDGERALAPHEEEHFMPRVHEQNCRTVLGAALAHAVEDDQAARTHLLELLPAMRTDVGTLSMDELDGATIHTSEAMINLCLAYDLLAADAEVESALREYLRTLAAEWVEFYSQGLGQAVLLLTQNNHNIKGAAGLAMVGMTLNDLPEAAGYVNYGLNDAWYFLTEYQSPEGGGQAEGPAYLAYSARNYLVAFWAYHRFAQGESWPYKISCIHRNEDCEETIVEFADPLTGSTMPAIHAWWRRIVMPSGHGPNIEDSSLNCLANGSIAGMWQDPQAAWLDSSLPRCNGYAWDTEMLRLAVAHLIPEPQEPAMVELDVMPEAGQAVFRTSWQVDAIYALLMGEHGLARAHGFGHEQAEATSFLLSAFGEYLLLDSGYISFGERSRVASAHNHNLVLVDGLGPPSSPIGMGADVDAWLEDGFSADSLAGVSVRSAWADCQVVRDVVFSDSSRFLLADHLGCDGDDLHDFELLWHTHGGGSSGGAFQEEANGFSVTRGDVKLQALVGAAGGGMNLTVSEAEHSMYHDQVETHSLVHAKLQAQDAAFLSVLVPMRQNQPPPTLRLIQAGQTAVGAELETGDHLEFFASNGTTAAMLFVAEGVRQSVETDARSLFLCLSPDGLQILSHQIFGGTFLRYGGLEVD